MVHISSDSTCDLPRDLIERYGIEIIPLYIQMGNKSLRDGAECTREDIFSYYEKTGQLCGTAAVTIGDYLDAFGEALKTSDEIVHFTISSDMSACYQNAVEAAAEFGGRVRVIDSRSLSTGIGLLAMDAAELAPEGRSAGEIQTLIDEKKARVNVSFVIDTLEYLYKGGRCSGVAALGANLLKLKPCIEVVGGLMTVGKKYRGSMEKCLETYVTERLDNGREADRRRIFVTDSGVGDQILERVTELLRERGFREILYSKSGGTISSHCGPGTLGILYYNL